MLQRDPPPGVWVGFLNDDQKLTELEGSIQGPTDTVYQGGVFKLSIHVPTRYAFSVSCRNFPLQA